MLSPTAFIPKRAYSRAQIREQVGDLGRGGAWDTGYRQYRGEFFIFAGVGAAGRTGHDYRNRWDGERLVWEAKNGSKLDDPQIRRLIGGRIPVHIFTRTN